MALNELEHDLDHSSHATPEHGADASEPHAKGAFWKKHKVEIIAAALGILVTLYLYYRSKQSSTAATNVANPAAETGTSGSYGGGGGGGGRDDNSSTTQPAQPDITVNVPPANIVVNVPSTTPNSSPMSTTPVTSAPAVTSNPVSQGNVVPDASGALTPANPLPGGGFGDQPASAAYTAPTYKALPNQAAAKTALTQGYTTYKRLSNGTYVATGTAEAKNASGGLYIRTS